VCINLDTERRRKTRVIYEREVQPLLPAPLTSGQLYIHATDGLNVVAECYIVLQYAGLL